MKKINIQELEYELTNRIKNKIEGGVYLVHDEELVIVSKAYDINIPYVKEKKLKIWNSRNFGGTIVAFPNDIDIGILKRDGWKTGPEILTKLKNYIHKEIIASISIEGNDLMIDGKYKVASFASINLGDDLIYTVVHISFNPNVEEIDCICQKKMRKIPKGLNDFGVSNLYIENILNNYDI